MGRSWGVSVGEISASAKRGLVAVERPGDWMPPSILRPPEVLTGAELAEAEAELKTLQRYALEIVDPEVRWASLTQEWLGGGKVSNIFGEVTLKTCAILKF